MINYRKIAEEIFLAGVESVLPVKLMADTISLKDNYLKIGQMSYSLKSSGNIYVIGAGKASAMMGREIENILGKRITAGHIVVKYGYSCSLKYIKVTEAGHPVPDSNGFKATGEILDIARRAGQNDLVICLLSGGGSSLLADVIEGCSSEEMIKLNDILIKSGAGIAEINAVRKHLSMVKGGQLARIVYPANLVNLILSDVPGDSLDVIASGPTVPDTTTFQQAVTVLDRWGLTDRIPVGMIKFLNEGVAGIRMETAKPGDPVFENTRNILVGTNRVALEAAKKKAAEYNLNPVVINDQVQGDTSAISELLIQTALKFRNEKSEKKPVCILFGGETTVRHDGRGTGGRSQHLALLSALSLQDKPGITILSAGTDGTDGPTDVAGAVVDAETIPQALLKNISPEKYLISFDSFHFFKKAGGHVITGPTFTNVMDIIVIIVE
jgi:glycerate 2-kinase